MSRNHFVFAVVAVAGIVAMSSAGQSRTDHGCADHMDEGFESIFNGKDLDGWTGDTAIYGVDPTVFSMIVFAAEPAKGPATPFDEYEKAMASSAKHPKAVEWQAANSAELAKLDDAWADGFLAGG